MRAILNSFLSLVVLIFLSCGGAQEYPELQNLQNSLDEHSTNVDEVEKKAAQLSIMWAGVVEDYRKAKEQYELAGRRYKAAINKNEETSENLQEVISEWKRAEKMWNVASLTIMAAATFSGNYKTKSVGSGNNQNQFCSNRSTSQHRKILKSQGRNIYGKDVDHIVPRSLGGADHPLNYQMLPDSINRSYGNSFGISKCVSAGPAKCALAIVISMLCGSYTGGIPSN